MKDIPFTPKKARAGIALTFLSMMMLLPTGAQAHDVWIEPSSTVLSGDQVAVTFDAAAGNDKFYYNHRGLSLDNLVVTGPAGQQIEAQNPFKGAVRSGFDITLTDDGTYRAALVTENGIFARWKEGDKPKRWFGKAQDLDKHVPKDAKDVELRERTQRIETFVTKGNPTPVQPVKIGLALVGDTHPNDLYAGETAHFVLTLDGQPAKGVEVEIARDGSRYRDTPEEIHTTTNDQGQLEVTWPKAGLYWLHADIKDNKTTSSKIKERGVSYAVTLEVLPQ